jgi:hypothetical protein
LIFQNQQIKLKFEIYGTFFEPAKASIQTDMRILGAKVVQDMDRVLHVHAQSGRRIRDVERGIEGPAKK